jgi:hypothetical protein
MEYSIMEHRHRFAVWAAARASQRKWKGASVDILGEALGHCGIVKFVRRAEVENLDREHFRELHRAWCRSVADYLTQRGVKDATFGRAAKLVAVYLKSMIVLGPASGTDLARVAYPPVDRILLQGVANCLGVDSIHKQAWRKANWTQLSEEQYYCLIDQLRATLAASEPFWVLEKFWTVTNGSEE